MLHSYHSRDTQGGRSRFILLGYRWEGERGCAEEEQSDEEGWFLRSEVRGS
jgi:hypothetical protein